MTSVGLVVVRRHDGSPPHFRTLGETMMELGAFSIILAIRDIAASKAFYEKSGFSVFGGNQDQCWLIMKSGTTLIGLF